LGRERAKHEERSDAYDQGYYGTRARFEIEKWLAGGAGRGHKSSMAYGGNESFMMDMQ